MSNSESSNFPYVSSISVCRKARSDARRAQAEADALREEAAELRQKADQLLKNLRAAEDDVSTGTALCSGT